MKKKFLLLICLVMIASVVLTACAMTNDDTALRKEGYNIVVSFDCGKYVNQTVTAYEDAAAIQYGEVLVAERADYIIGKLDIESYPVRKFYYNTEDACVIEPGTTTQLPSPQLRDRVFAGWYVASVVEYKLDENGNPIKNKLGQYEYGGAVPQASDVKWDFSNTIGTYENHPYSPTKYVYDATQPFDAQVTVGGQTVTNGAEYTDEQLGYNAENGFNVYLYAKWTVQSKFIVEADIDGDGTWEEVLRLNPDPNRNQFPSNKEADLKQKGYTFYNLYSDKNFTNAWDYTTKFNDVYTGSVDSLRPYVIVYAKYLEGDWNVVRTAAQLNGALTSNKNIYLDADITYTGYTVWAYAANYTSEFKGNNHVITFENVMDNPTDRNTINYGLFGTFAGKMSDVEFVNVTINMKNYPAQTSVNCGVLAGLVSADATFSNVKVSGKVVYSDTIRSRANVENEEGKITLKIYRGDETNVDADSWYGVKSGNVSGVTYVNTVNTEDSGNSDSAE